jgi:hypothetical protein
MEEIEKLFIPYEEALELKQLGFDKDCFGYYENDILILCYDSKQDYELLLNCSAPLYSQAFRWLLTLVNKDKLFSNKWKISYNEDYYSLFLGGCNMGVFEAELECLKKLIKIVKEKK